MGDEMLSGAKKDPRVLFLNAEDNVGVACTNLAAGTALGIDGNSVTLPVDVELGHKLARAALVEGDKIIKWGAEIGSVTQAVAIGGHVHLHNMKSDYIPTYTFEEGQRFVAGEEK